MALQADNARKALSQLPARQPKRLFGYLMLAGFRERARLRETTKWLHAINGDPLKGRSKREVREELGFGRHDEGLTKVVKSPALEVEVTIDNPARRGMALTYLDGLSDVGFTATSEAVKGSVTVTRWEIRGTHTGTLLGVPPTGNDVSLAGITWISFDERRNPDGSTEVWATEEWTYWDLLSLMEQIGATL